MSLYDILNRYFLVRLMDPCFADEKTKNGLSQDLTMNPYSYNISASVSTGLSQAALQFFSGSLCSAACSSG